MKNLTETEPALLTGTIGAVLAAIVTVVVAFVDFSAEQTAAILGLVAVLTPLVTALVTRGRVWSPASHEKALEAVATARRRP